MPRFVIRAEHFVKEGAMEKWLLLAHANATESLKEAGVQRFDICVSRDDPNRALLYEIYGSRDEWLAHCETAHFKAFIEGVKDLIEKRDRGYFDLLN
ncbi:MAG: putative quinol monooxygenase [Betaproteobacteria bacterium]